MYYSITIRDQDRNRTKWKLFNFKFQARTWMLINGFYDGFNMLTLETAEIKKRTIGV